uniref:Uncharacterized protein n=1 Tax=Triticum urartu TaxID=4572 RepID=A0A8R7Q3P3_TRIUA
MRQAQHRNNKSDVSIHFYELVGTHTALANLAGGLRMHRRRGSPPSRPYIHHRSQKKHQPFAPLELRRKCCPRRPCRRRRSRLLASSTSAACTRSPSSSSTSST